ncbi:MAG: T9SS type A sorting domain-containing protein [Flavobacteriales bacterium]|nr:T9SS type A sorting domain-containing protein [Flavobacteriales bacterium]
MLCLSFTILQNEKANACVDHATTVTVTCHYDTTNFTDIALTVSNLRLFGGNPNEFCSCAVTSWTDIFTDISYVAFVDSGTTIPVPGFDPYVADANATSAWESVLATGGWSGFVSEVNGNGLTANAPVELIIRASLPPGYTYSILYSSFEENYLGTDEWDNTSQDLANSHQNLLFLDIPTFIVVNDGSTYFTDLDNAILTNVEMLGAEKIKIYPVPATNEIRIQLNQAEIENLSIYSISGQLINSHDLTAFRDEEYTLDIREYSSGIYHVLLRSSSGIVTEKFMKE